MNLESIQSAKMIGRKEVNERMMGILVAKEFSNWKINFHSFLYEGLTLGQIDWWDALGDIRDEP